MTYIRKNYPTWELFDTINPVSHGDSSAGIATYKVELYVATADIYAVAPHTGRGHWTWYTGSAGWMYRLVIESLLGVTLKINMPYIASGFPLAWENVKLHYRYRETRYHITMHQRHGENEANRITIDTVAQPDDSFIPLVDDRQEHAVEVLFHLV